MASSSTSPANEILDRLPSRIRDQVDRAGRLIDLNPGKQLHNYGEATSAYYFPLSGAVSLTVGAANGERIEVGLVGRSGMVGVASLLGDNGHDLDAMAQVRGRA